MKMNDYNLPFELKYCMTLLNREIIERRDEVFYDGDCTDFGNEVGYCIGRIIENMTERQIRDFIHGLQHGISLTNGTH